MFFITGPMAPACEDATVITFPVEWRGADGPMGELTVIVSPRCFSVRETKSSGFALSQAFEPQSRELNGGWDNKLYFTGGVRSPNTVLNGPVAERIFRQTMKAPQPADVFLHLINLCLKGDHPHQENRYGPDAAIASLIGNLPYHVELVCGTPLTYPVIRSRNGMRWPKVDDNPYLYGWARRQRWQSSHAVVIEPFKLRPHQAPIAVRNTGHEKAEFLSAMGDLLNALNALKYHALTQPHERMARRAKR